MTILIAGSTGNLGSLVLAELAHHPVHVRALTRDVGKADFPLNVEAIEGDVLDIERMRTVLAGVSTLFLINPVAEDELAQALTMLGLARDMSVKGIVYISMLNSDVLIDTPHSAAKLAAEQTIARFRMPATVLRPTYFMQNDLLQKDALEKGFYAMPIGGIGVSMIDIRDLAELASQELLRRELSDTPLATTTIDVVGPHVITGEQGAAIWSKAMGTEVRYAGDDVAALEKRLASRRGAWLAYDQALMFRGFQRDGMIPAEGAWQEVSDRLNRPLRTYESFAQEQARAWQG